jgi:hypothetical protein
MKHMYFNSTKTALLVLAITAIVCSRILFSFIKDSEGPNLLVVMGLAAIVYVASLLSVHVLAPSSQGLKRYLLVIAIQILLVFGLYFCLN